MVALRFSVTIGEDRRLVIDLPPEMPLGPAEANVVIEMALSSEAVPDDRAVLMARLRAAGVIRESVPVPVDARQLSDMERIKIGTLPPGARPSHELIDEDRGSR
jgi:hypothetical protein